MEPKIVFKNLEKSEMARSVVLERVEPIISKFPDLKTHHVILTLEMENSPQQAGPDSFTVKVLIKGAKYKNLMLSRTSSNLYAATAMTVDGLLERLNRAGDKKRVRKVKQGRKMIKIKKIFSEKL